MSLHRLDDATRQRGRDAVTVIRMMLDDRTPWPDLTDDEQPPVDHDRYAARRDLA